MRRTRFWKFEKVQKAWWTSWTKSKNRNGARSTWKRSHNWVAIATIACRGTVYCYCTFPVDSPLEGLQPFGFCRRIGSALVAINPGPGGRTSTARNQQLALIIKRAAIQSGFYGLVAITRIIKCC
mmetsp:Transcript_27214/g.66043  ORF Transcript_27214/g.66043 Transcript_27214/m.66043 type:complete len:125 (-) Transcript_27214:345-719(-)